MSIGAPQALDVDALIEPDLQTAVAALDGSAPQLAAMARYHLGWDEADPALAQAARGKRMRPAVALLCCAAVHGEPARAAPLAAAVELLHNFSLVHDDVQDASPTRRHRPTVWARWNIGQAINAGDALLAAAHLALLRLRSVGVPGDLVLELGDAFDRMAIELVAGQVLDLGFESQPGIGPADYLRMIEGKTAAILRFAAWGGARLGGADDAIAARFAAFGRGLGLAFQVHDDLLGVWGAPAATGKAAAEDIRRRKRGLPLLILREQATPDERAALAVMDAAQALTEDDVARVLDLLDRHDVRHAVATRAQALYAEARDALQAAVGPGENPARDRLIAELDTLAARGAFALMAT